VRPGLPAAAREVRVPVDEARDDARAVEVDLVHVERGGQGGEVRPDPQYAPAADEQVPDAQRRGA
jgi:hypothetical protein